MLRTSYHQVSRGLFVLLCRPSPLTSFNAHCFENWILLANSQRRKPNAQQNPFATASHSICNWTLENKNSIRCSHLWLKMKRLHKKSLRGTSLNAYYFWRSSTYYTKNSRWSSVCCVFFWINSFNWKCLHEISQRASNDYSMKSIH